MRRGKSGWQEVRRRSTRIGGLLVMGLLITAFSACPALGAPLYVEQTQVVPDAPTCTECRVELEPIVTLGEPGAGPLLGDWVTIHSDGSRFFVIDGTTHPGQVVVFGRSGEHRHSLGRRGEGPGEFKGPSRVLSGPGDSLHVFDMALGRISIFDSDYGLARTVRLESPVEPFSMAIHPSGRYLTAAAIGTPSSVGFPLHWLDFEGRTERSFGESHPTFLPGDELELYRSVHLRDDGSFWTARRNEITLELRSAEGRVIRTLVRRPAWFEPYRRQHQGDFWSEPPDPILVDVYEDEATGTLWTLSNVPAQDWRFVPPNQRPQDFLDQAELAFETVMEVMDLKTFRVVTRRRFARTLNGFLHGGEVYGRRVLENGEPVWDVMRPRISP